MRRNEVLGCADSELSLHLDGAIQDDIAKGHGAITTFVKPPNPVR